MGMAYEIILICFAEGITPGDIEKCARKRPVKSFQSPPHERRYHNGERSLYFSGWRYRNEIGVRRRVKLKFIGDMKLQVAKNSINAKADI